MKTSIEDTTFANPSRESLAGLEADAIEPQGQRTTGACTLREQVFKVLNTTTLYYKHYGINKWIQQKKKKNKKTNNKNRKEMCNVEVLRQSHWNLFGLQKLITADYTWGGYVLL